MNKYLFETTKGLVIKETCSRERARQELILEHYQSIIYKGQIMSTKEIQAIRIDTKNNLLKILKNA